METMGAESCLSTMKETSVEKGARMPEEALKEKPKTASTITFALAAIHEVMPMLTLMPRDLHWVRRLSKSSSLGSRGYTTATS